MISPALIMETEFDTESDSDDDSDDTTNIYEEVLNKDNQNTRQYHSRLSTTSSVYSSGGWNWERREPVSYYHKVEEQIIHFHFFYISFHFSICSFNQHQWPTQLRLSLAEPLNLAQWQTLIIIKPTYSIQRTIVTEKKDIVVDIADSPKELLRIH